jgi:N-acetylmuramoyl-L-alanine amidase
MCGMALARHTVRQGECLSSIAYDYGFRDPADIFGHADNAALRQQRSDPNLLYPGDEVVIPDRKQKTLVLATSARHRIVVTLPKRKVSVRVLNAQGEPTANQPFTIEADGDTYKGETDDRGIATRLLPANVKNAVLCVGGGRMVLDLGHLNPIEKTEDEGVSGLQARLANLGYPPGAIDGQLGPKTAAALRAFQRDRQLDETGTLDSDTLQALKDCHAC